MTPSDRGLSALFVVSSGTGAVGYRVPLPFCLS